MDKYSSNSPIKVSSPFLDSFGSIPWLISWSHSLAKVLASLQEYRLTEPIARETGVPVLFFLA